MARPDVVEDGGRHGAHGRGDGLGQPGALGQVGRLDRVHDEAAGHPVQRQGQGDRVIQAEAVRTRRPCDAGPWPVHHETMDLTRMRRLGADRVDDHGQHRPGPGLDQPSGLAVGDHEFHAGGHPVAQLADDRGPGAIIAAELVAYPDHHDRPAART